MSHRIPLWILVGATFDSSAISEGLPFADTRELDQEFYQLLNFGIAQPEVVGRAGLPERGITQFESTPSSRRVISYQYALIVSKDNLSMLFQLMQPYKAKCEHGIFIQRA